MKDPSSFPPPRGHTLSLPPGLPAPAGSPSPAPLPPLSLTRALRNTHSGDIPPPRGGGWAREPNGPIRTRLTASWSENVELPNRKGLTARFPEPRPLAAVPPPARLLPPPPPVRPSPAARERSLRDGETGAEVKMAAAVLAVAAASRQ